MLTKKARGLESEVEFEEIPPTKCQFIRFTITDWPRIGDTPLGIMEFTVFGKPVESL